MERDYGGAFDIAPEQYWTREDIDEVISEVENIFEKKKIRVYVVDSYINYENGKDVFDIDYHYITPDGEHFYGSLFNRITIDNRRAKNTELLVKIYAPEIVDELINEMHMMKYMEN